MWKKLSIVSLTLWLITICIISYYFYFGSTVQSLDQRTEIIITRTERNMILSEMRDLLKGVQQIIRSANQNNFKEVSTTARSLGIVMASEAGHPALLKKFPLAFKKLGLGVHRSFDSLADRAESLNTNQVLTETTNIMNSCITCHATYRLLDH